MSGYGNFDGNKDAFRAMKKAAIVQKLTKKGMAAGFTEGQVEFLLELVDDLIDQQALDGYIET